MRRRSFTLGMLAVGASTLAVKADQSPFGSPPTFGTTVAVMKATGPGRPGWTGEAYWQGLVAGRKGLAAAVGSYEAGVVFVEFTTEPTTLLPRYAASLGTVHLGPGRAFIDVAKFTGLAWRATEDGADVPVKGDNGGPSKPHVFNIAGDIPDVIRNGVLLSQNDYIAIDLQLTDQTDWTLVIAMTDAVKALLSLALELPTPDAAREGP